MPAPRARCGDCARWGTEADESGGFRPCLWTRPVMPFWANLDEGSDHDDWTTADQGRGCQIFERKDEE